MSTLDSELDDYLKRARDRNESLYQQPTFGQPFRTPLFEFVRAAKAHPILAEMGAFAAAQTVEQYLRSWILTDAANPWEECFPNSDDPPSGFIDTWDKIKWARPEVDYAFQAAKTLPLKPIHAYSASYVLFVSIAGHLQKHISGPILLPCRKFAELLGCEPMSISRYRHLAVKAGILRLERRGRKQHREADEFCFATEKFDWTTGNEIEPEKRDEPEQMLHRYSDIKEIERNKDSQEKQEMQDSPREPRAQIFQRRNSKRQSECMIPTTEELERTLKANAHLLKSFPDPTEIQ